MKKKSLVAMGLAGVMTIGMCVPVLAADSTEITQESVNRTESTDISYELKDTYKVTIPKTISIDSENKTYDFGGTVGNINDSKRLTISISDINNSKIKLTDIVGNNANKADVKVTLGTENVGTDGIVASYVQDDSVGQLKNEKGVFTINKPEEDIWAGTYETTVTFTVALNTVTP